MFRSTFRDTIAVVCLAAMLTAGIAALAADGGGGAELDRRVERGKRLYEIYCSNCHGDTGRGDGPTAEYLKIPPTDLTRLASDNDGEFPMARIYTVIDGREAVRAHGRSSMPIWGLVFQQHDIDTGQEDEARERILALSEYLVGIQQKR